MGQPKPSLTAVALISVVVLAATSAYPMTQYIPRYSPPVRLTLHAPVTGADIALARGQALQPFLSPRISSVGDYVYVEDVLPGVDPGYPYKQDAKNHVIILNKPELGNLNVGGHPGHDFY